MALTLTQQVENNISIEANGIIPGLLRGQTTGQIKSLMVACGNEMIALGELFSVSGAMDQTETVVFDGFLKNVHGIGMEMGSGSHTDLRRYGESCRSKDVGWENPVAGECGESRRNRG